MSDTEQALASLQRAHDEIAQLWDCEPNRSLGWVEDVLRGLIRELDWKVKKNLV